MAYFKIPLIWLGAMGLYLAFSTWSDFRRRSTLRQRDNGVYFWIEWDGAERTSVMDPSQPGGEWDCDGDDGGDGGD